MYLVRALILHTIDPKECFQQPRWQWLWENRATFWNTSSPLTVCQPVGNSTSCHDCCIHQYAVMNEERCLQVRPMMHLGFWAYVFIFLSGNLVQVVFEVWGFHMWFLPSFPYSVNLLWVSLLWEWAKPLQGIFGLAVIHPEIHLPGTCMDQLCRNTL